MTASDQLSFPENAEVVVVKMSTFEEMLDLPMQDFRAMEDLATPAEFR